MGAAPRGESRSSSRLDPALKSMQFIEDGVVPPARLADYVRGVRSALAAHDTSGVIFGHAGDAHVHVNPLVDVSRDGWRDRVEAILSDVVDLTATLGGSLSGEHGDGALRAPLLDRTTSVTSRELAQRVKHAFDPERSPESGREGRAAGSAGDRRHQIRPGASAAAARGGAGARARGARASVCRVSSRHAGARGTRRIVFARATGDPRDPRSPSPVPGSPFDFSRAQITVLSRPAFAEPAHLPVNWLGESTDGERLAEFAGRLCYMSQRNPANRTTRDYLENIKKQGHGSVLEHVNYSVLVEGVSRSLTHELVRHRAGWAYSQLSQRYVDESVADFVMPPAVIGDEALERTWREQVESAQRTYVTLVDELMQRYGWVADKVHRRKMAREAARAVLPNATETKIVATGNVRAWRTMLELRSSEGAELEIRRFAIMALRLMQSEAPAILLGLRDLRCRRSERGGEDRLP